MLFQKKFIYPVLLLIACLAFYGRALSFDYVWDDPLIFLDKNSIMVDPLSWRLLTEPILAGTTYMRPLVVMTWFVEFRLFGQRPEISHAINVAIYIANVYLVYCLGLASARRLILPEVGPGRAFLGALFYASHPALIESTAWVAGRFDLMATFFILVAVYFYLKKPADDIRRGILISILMLLALMCKELGIVIPGVIFFVWMASRTLDVQRKAPWEFFGNNKILLILISVTVLAYFAIRRDAMGGVYHAVLSLDYLLNVFRLMLPFEALKEYILMTLIPFSRVAIFHPLTLLNTFSPISIFGNILTLIIVLLVSWYAFVRARVWACWLMAGGFCLLPVIHVLPINIGDNIIQDRFMTSYLAFVAVALVSLPWTRVVMNGVVNTKIIRFGLFSAGFLWFALAFITIWAVIPLWKNELTLWSWTHKKYPDIEAVRYNYMTAALASDRPELVEVEIKRLQEKNGGLEVGEQALYGNLLNRAADREGLKYLEGVIFALPKFHEEDTSLDRASKFQLSSVQMAAIYMDYAAGLLAYRGDADLALKYNKISTWYLPSSQNMPLMYQRAALYYAAGRYLEAEELMNSLDGIYHYNKRRQQRGVHQLLNIFCKNFPERTKICSELAARKMVDN